MFSRSYAQPDPSTSESDTEVKHNFSGLKGIVDSEGSDSDWAGHIIRNFIPKWYYYCLVNYNNFIVTNGIDTV